MQTIKNGTKIDDFVILRLIARGGMGEVYEAYEQTLDRRVALKIVSPKADKAADLVRRFKREARILAKVNNPNIVTVYAIKSGEDFQYLSMELVDGVSFKDFIAEFPLPVPIAMTLFARSLAAVQVVHDLNIIHRDLKPSNILFNKTGEIKILDFGIAQFAGSDADKGVVVGSPPYMAPELNEGAQAGWLTECWSLGTILFEIVTGQMLFHRLKDGELRLSDSDLDKIPETVLNIIKKACAKDPKDRYQSAEEMHVDLANCQKHLPEVTESQRLKLQAQVKELINRAQYMIDTQIVRNAAAAANTTIQNKNVSIQGPTETRIGGSEKTLPQVPTGQEDFSASTIVARKPAPHQNRSSLDPSSPAFNPRVDKKPFMKWASYGALMSLVLAGTAHYVVTQKSDLFGNSIQAVVNGKGLKVSQILDSAKPKQESRLSGSNLAALEKNPDRKQDTKPEARVEPQGGLETEQPVQLVSPVNGEPHFAETSRVEFKWNQNLKSGQYRIEISKDPQFDKNVFQQAVSGSSYGWKKQTTPGFYYWRLVPAKKVKGEPLQAERFQVLDQQAIQLEFPKPKFDYIIQTNEPATVEFKWDCKTGIEQYQIEISQEATFANAMGTAVNKNCGWSTSLGEGTYFWRVRSARAVKDRDFASEAQSFKITKKLVPAVKMAAKPAKKERAAKPVLTLLSPTKGAKAPTRNGQVSIEFSWKPQSSASKYILELSSDAAFSDTVEKYEAQDSKFLVEGISQTGRLYWRVKPETNSGPGEWSEASYLDLF